MDKGTEALARKYAIKNAVEYDGKASFASVLSKVISKVGRDRMGMPELSALIAKIVKEVNSMTLDQQRTEYSKYGGEFQDEYLKKVEETSSPSMELEGAEVGNFATRFAPEPSGYMHIGHAKVVFLEQELARIYKGRSFLYFDDTNPEQESQEFVDAIKRDLDWLGVKFDKEYYASDSIEKVYEYARKLIEKGRAYVCTCDQETIRKDRFAGVSCAHSRTPESESMLMFGEMLDGEYDEGQAVLRFRGDMGSENTALRDPTLMRVKKGMHYRQGGKYLVWPTYDFNTPIMDSIHGVTDGMRSKEYEIRDPLYHGILRDLNLRDPRMHYESRLSIKGTITSKRQLKKLIKEGLISEYDDPRLATISALRRRGILPEAIKRFVLRFGMSVTDRVVDLSYLLAENKRLIDPTAKRLFFVADPVRLELDGFRARTITLRLHPNSDLGRKEYGVGNILYISGGDSEKLDSGSAIRLKELAAVRISSISGNAMRGSPIDADTGKDIATVQWVSEGNYRDCKVLVPNDIVDRDGNFIRDSMGEIKGYIESYADLLHQGEPVQLERFGFAVFDGVEGGAKRFIFMTK